MLHQNPLDRIPRLHIDPHAKTPRTPYPAALHPLPLTQLPQGFTMTVTRIAGEAAEPADGAIARPRDVAEHIADCWRPAPTSGDDTREISLRLSFSRDGGVIGAPAVTYAKAGPDPVDREALRSSILAAVNACTPLRFTGGLGSAIAGLPFAIRFVALRRDPAFSQTP